MKISILLNYATSFGEDLYITGTIPALKNADGSPLPMEYSAQGWKITFKTEAKNFRYSFLMKKEGNFIRCEKEDAHEFGAFDKGYKNILILEHIRWNEKCPRMMQSTVFTHALRPDSISKQKCISKAKVPILFQTRTDKVFGSNRIGILGNDRLLGNWLDSGIQEMNSTKGIVYNTFIDADKVKFPLEYKYVIYNDKKECIISWEEGGNHHLNPELSIGTDLIIVNDATPQFNLPAFKGAGTAIPIFSLRSKKSFGCGEFLDLKLLGDWCAKSGQTIIQTLPINDTSVFGTWKDSYPYSAISVYALHPIYLNLEAMGLSSKEKDYQQKRKELNQLEFVDYEEVMRLKWSYIKRLYKEQKESLFNNEEYQTFYEENKEWLKPYAVFCYLRDKYHTSDYTRWEDDAQYNSKRIDQYCQSKHKNFDEIALHFFTQYHLDKQLSESIKYLHKKGIAIKGDIPIGVNRHSVDVWVQPELFDCSGCAGAPPDYFAKTGQIWGFPIYNWNLMEKDNYAWWEKRFKKMARHFDAYRIDHILGFFRIFRIPSNARLGLLGQFVPALPLSSKEIERYNLGITPKDFCRPIITDEIIKKIAGKELAEEIKSKYLIATENGRYELKQAYSTHEKIEKKFQNKNEEEQKIAEILMLLLCQVYFVEDYKEKGKYHPRIAIEQSELYETLDNVRKKNIKELYDYFYYLRHNDYWKAEAMKKLSSLIGSTEMMVCGEDLGMVPPCVPSVMEELEILSLEIQRMPKELFVEFGSLKRVGYPTVCTTSTHDMSTMRQWWEEDKATTQRYYSNELKQFGPAPFFCEPWICQQIIEEHLHTNAAWVILPLQDWMGISGELRWNETFKERINDPGDPNNYWRYRMHITLEQLNENKWFSLQIKSMIEGSGRYAE
jgi:4-alpha-glucanotransferase